MQAKSDLTGHDYHHMPKIIGYVHRHVAQGGPTGGMIRLRRIETVSYGRYAGAGRPMFGAARLEPFADDRVEAQAQRFIPSVKRRRPACALHASGTAPDPIWTGGCRFSAKSQPEISVGLQSQSIARFVHGRKFIALHQLDRLVATHARQRHIGRRWRIRQVGDA